MYKYYEELEKPNSYAVWLKRILSSDKDRDFDINYIPLTFLNDIGDIFERIKFIDILIDGLKYNEELGVSNYPSFSSYDEWNELGDFYSTLKENVYGLEEDPPLDEEYILSHDDSNIEILKKQLEMYHNDIDEYYMERHYNMCIRSYTLKHLLSSYSYYASVLATLIPDYKDYLLETSMELKKVKKRLDDTIRIEVSPEKDGLEYIFPNAWYITPDGYLYNTGSGHKMGNFVDQFYCEIKPLLENGKKISHINNYEVISDIYKREYITSSEFRTYANLKYEIPTIETPEIELAKIQRKKFMEKNRGKELDFDDLKNLNLLDDKRTYQSRIINLVVGWKNAEQGLVNSFEVFNDVSAERKKELIKQLSKMVSCLSDMFVRFCGFNKVESTIDKTITTSSLNIDKFKEYLSKGWTLQIIPGIIYDKKEDILTTMDFNSYFIEKYIDKKMEEYDGKGKILINKLR
ncbi:MAG: hypothetical protein IJ565_04990 [Bacilli bacterium]|nr:hypothetical protein [Bacilli bacterium]